MLTERFSEVSYVTLPRLRVACFRAVSRTPEDDAEQVLNRWAAGAGIHDTPRSFGFEAEVSPEQAAAGLRAYELWYVVPPNVIGTGQVDIRVFPGGRFAAITIHDPFEDPFTYIPAGWQALHEWVLAEGLDSPGEILCLEEVVRHNGGQDMVLYHPLVAN